MPIETAGVKQREKVPDQRMTRKITQRVAVVTGASAGVGKSTARMFAERGWHVIGTGRDPARTTAAEAEIRAAAVPGARIDFLRGDFDLMAEVNRVADEIARLTPKVDVLVNNAGGVRDRLIMTAEGNEAIFASNHLAPFLLTRQLMPLLKSAAAVSPPGAVRVLAVSSSGHEYSPPFDWDDLQTLTKYTPGRAYCRAKLANILFTRELTRRVAEDGITAQAMHPGDVASNFHSHADEVMRAHSKTQERVEPDEPAETLLWLATAPEAGVDGGRYFHRREEVAAAPQALDDEAARRLWEESEKLLARIGVQIAA